MYQYYAGIDLHKRSSTWIIINTKREVVWEQQVNCDPRALDFALSICPVPLNEIQATIEPVCGFRWFQKQLSEAGVNTVLANPTKVRLIAQSKHKNDRNDARMLAELLATGYLPLAYLATDEVHSLRSLMRERHYLVSVRTGFKNRIKGVVTALGIHDIREDCLKQSGIRYIKEHGITELEDLQGLCAELTSYIKKLDKAIQTQVQQHSLVTLITSVPTVGLITAGTILAEVGDFNRFKTAKQLASYAGLCPCQRSSGEKVHYGGITKVGSKYLRYVLVEAAMRFRIHHDPVIFAWYEQIKKMHSPMKARVALARKLLTIMWYMAKTNTPYTPRQHTAK